MMWPDETPEERDARWAARTAESVARWYGTTDRESER